MHAERISDSYSVLPASEIARLRAGLCRLPCINSKTLCSAKLPSHPSCSFALGGVRREANANSATACLCRRQMAGRDTNGYSVGTTIIITRGPACSRPLLQRRNRNVASRHCALRSKIQTTGCRPRYFLDHTTCSRHSIRLLNR